MGASTKKIVVVVAGLAGLGAAAYFFLRGSPATSKGADAPGPGASGLTPEQLMSLLRDPAARARAQAQAAAAGATSVGTNRLIPGGSAVVAGAGVVSAVGAAAATAIALALGVGVPIVGAIVGAVIVFLMTVLPSLLGTWVGTVPGDTTPPVDWLTPEGDAAFRRDGIVATTNPEGKRVIVTRWGVFEGVSADVEGQKIVVTRADGAKRTVIDVGAMRASLDRLFGAGVPPESLRRPVPPPPAAAATWLTAAQRAQYMSNGGFVVVTVPDTRYQPLRGQRVVVTPTSVVPGIAAVLQPDPATTGMLKLTVLDEKGLVRSVIRFAPVRYGVSGVLGQSVRRVYG